MLALSILNVVAAIAVVMVSEFVVSIGYVNSMSRYREFDLDGAIDYEKIRQLRGDEVGEDWGAVVEYLIGDSMRGLLDMDRVFAGGFALNSFVLFAMWYLSRERKRAVGDCAGEGCLPPPSPS